MTALKNITPTVFYLQNIKSYMTGWPCRLSTKKNKVWLNKRLLMMGKKWNQRGQKF